MMLLVDTSHEVSISFQELYQVAADEATGTENESFFL
jgi:hypothetical protein